MTRGEILFPVAQESTVLRLTRPCTVLTSCVTKCVQLRGAEHMCSLIS